MTIVNVLERNDKTGLCPSKSKHNFKQMWNKVAFIYFLHLNIVLKIIIGTVLSIL